MNNILFIPQPANIVNTGFSHYLSRKTIIVLPEQADDDDDFAARHLKAGIREYLKYNVDVNRRFADDFPTPHILLLRADRDVKWLQAYDVPELVKEGYFISISTDRVLLVGADAAGLYYAVQTLRQVIDQQGAVLSGLAITDHPTLPVRGVMLDVSRGKVPTLKDLLGTVELLASWKINQFQLYIEHTFAWPSHPKIGKGYGPLTPEDILVLDAACAQRHIELVPNLQSFGHHAHLLNHHEYEHLMESPARWTLSPVVPDTYKLLDELYAEFLPNFRSKLFNIDADETWDLGKGKSAVRVAEVGIGRVYLEHLLHVRALAEKYGRKIMFWGDIILHNPELIPEVPDDVIALQWDYWREPKEEQVRLFAEAGKRFYVCPGTSSWSCFFPVQQVMRENISKMTEYAVKYGATGLLNTDWGDGGHYNLQGVSYYAYAYGAAQSWNPSAVEQFDDAFGRLFFGIDGFKVMAAMHHLERAIEPAPLVFIWGAQTLHQKCLQGPLFREQLKLEYTEKMTENARSAYVILAQQPLLTRQPLVVQELLLAAYQQRLLSMKAHNMVEFHQSYREIYERSDINAFISLVDALQKDLNIIAKMAAQVPEMFAPLWRARAHTAGLKWAQEYQMEVVEEIEDTIDTLNKMCEKARKTGMIPELPPIDSRWQPKEMLLQMGIVV